MDNLYVELNNFQISWGQSFLSQTEIIKKHYHDFFRYHTKLNDVGKDFIRHRNQFKHLYEDSLNKLKNKKEKLFDT